MGNVLQTENTVKKAEFLTGMAFINLPFLSLGLYLVGGHRIAPLITFL